MRIPPRFSTVSLGTFVEHTPSQAGARAAVTEWLNKVHDGAMLALIGSQGCGKSHLLYSAVHELDARIAALDLKQRVGTEQPYVRPWYALADELRYGRVDVTEAGSRQIDPAEVRTRFWERRIVLIDEVRPTSGTNFDDTELAKFACHAYDNRIAVLITTNVNPLSDVLGAAAASRFNQVVVIGPDARQE